MDEAYEALTLDPDRKVEMVPVILMDTEESGYWDLWLEFAETTLLKQGMISADDLHLFDRCHEQLAPQTSSVTSTPTTTHNDSSTASWS